MDPGEPPGRLTKPEQSPNPGNAHRIDAAGMRRRVMLAAGVAAVLMTGGLAAGTATARPGAAARPNIVFVLTDDLAWNLVQYLPQVRDLQARGTTFTDYVVTD